MRISDGFGKTWFPRKRSAAPEPRRSSFLPPPPALRDEVEFTKQRIFHSPLNAAEIFTCLFFIQGPAPRYVESFFEAAAKYIGTAFEKDYSASQKQAGHFFPRELNCMLELLTLLQNSSPSASELLERFFIRSNWEPFPSLLDYPALKHFSAASAVAFLGPASTVRNLPSLFHPNYGGSNDSLKGIGDFTKIALNLRFIPFPVFQHWMEFLEATLSAGGALDTDGYQQFVDMVGFCSDYHTLRLAARARRVAIEFVRTHHDYYYSACYGSYPLLREMNLRPAEFKALYPKLKEMLSFYREHENNAPGYYHGAIILSGEAARTICHYAQYLSPEQEEELLAQIFALPKVAQFYLGLALVRRGRALQLNLHPAALYSSLGYSWADEGSSQLQRLECLLDYERYTGSLPEELQGKIDLFMPPEDETFFKYRPDLSPSIVSLVHKYRRANGEKGAAFHKWVAAEFHRGNMLLPLQCFERDRLLSLLPEIKTALAALPPRRVDPNISPLFIYDWLNYFWETKFAYLQKLREILPRAEFLDLVNSLIAGDLDPVSLALFLATRFEIEPESTLALTEEICRSLPEGRMRTYFFQYLLDQMKNPTRPSYKMWRAQPIFPTRNQKLVAAARLLYNEYIALKHHELGFCDYPASEYEFNFFFAHSNLKTVEAAPEDMVLKAKLESIFGKLLLFKSKKDNPEGHKTIEELDREMEDLGMKWEVEAYEKTDPVMSRVLAKPIFALETALQLGLRAAAAVHKIKTSIKLPPIRFKAILGRDTFFFFDLRVGMQHFSFTLLPFEGKPASAPRSTTPEPARTIPGVRIRPQDNLEEGQSISVAEARALRAALGPLYYAPASVTADEAAMAAVEIAREPFDEKLSSPSAILSDYPPYRLAGREEWLRRVLGPLSLAMEEFLKEYFSDK